MAAIPLNQAARRQPRTPSLAPALHLNLLIASLAVGGAERCVQDILLGLQRRQPTGKLFVLHEMERTYAVPGTAHFPVIRLGSLVRGNRMPEVALEVLASPSPVVYTHLIRARDLRVCGAWA